MTVVLNAYCDTLQIYFLETCIHDCDTMRIVFVISGECEWWLKITKRNNNQIMAFFLFGGMNLFLYKTNFS